MPDVSGPFDSAAFLQGGWYRDRGHFEPSGVQGPAAATPGAGDLALTATGLDLSLGLGRAHVRGAYYERTGSTWTNAVPANTSTVGPRHDLIVLRRDLAAKTVTPTRIQGTPAATPADPALSLADDGSWDLPLFRVLVPANSGTPLVITDLRRFLGIGGNGIRLGSTQPAGEFGGEYRDHPTRGLERWTGTAWDVPTPLPYCQAVATAAQAFANSTWSVVTLHGETHDSDNMHAANGTRITAPVKGVYRASGSVTYASAGAATRLGSRITYNNTVVPQGISMEYAHPGLEYTVSTPPQLITCAAGDYLELQTIQQSGGNLSTVVIGDSRSFLTVECIRLLA